MGPARLAGDRLAAPLDAFFLLLLPVQSWNKKSHINDINAALQMKLALAMEHNATIQATTGARRRELEKSLVTCSNDDEIADDGS